MEEIMCHVNGCEIPAMYRGKRLCQAHYHRLWRTGSLNEELPLKVWRAEEGPCDIEGCEKPKMSRGWCDMHYTRFKRHGDPLTVKEKKLHIGKDHFKWTGDEATYAAVHQRLKKEFGSARDQACIGCGNEAKQWAYNHTDVNVRHSEYGDYSTDLSRYNPMCTPCHKRFDLGVIEKAKALVA